MVVFQLVDTRHIATSELLKCFIFMREIPIAILLFVYLEYEIIINKINKQLNNRATTTYGMDLRQPLKAIVRYTMQ
jgi:hypothetical protein